MKVQIQGVIGLKSIIRCLILLETRNSVPSMIFVVTTIEEGAVSFFQDVTAIPTYLLEGYCVCFISTKLIYKDF